MKKILLTAIFLIFGGMVHAQTNTFTPTVTSTPTSTFTFTPTPLYFPGVNQENTQQKVLSKLLAMSRNYNTPIFTYTPTVTQTPTVTNSPTASFTPMNTLPPGTNTYTPTPTYTSSPTYTPTPTPTPVGFIYNVIANATVVPAIAAPPYTGQYILINGMTITNTGATSVGVTILSGTNVVWQGQADANLTTGPDSIVIPYPVACPRNLPVSIGITASTTNLVVSGIYQYTN